MVCIMSKCVKCRVEFQDPAEICPFCGNALSEHTGDETFLYPKLKEQMLDVINPQYIILKPALAGGLSGSAEWIDKAEKRNIGWWITSALESNVGLNAIAQWTAMLQSSIPQGLGTGQLYKNNIISPLVQKGSTIQYDPSLSWDLSSLIWE